MFDGVTPRAVVDLDRRPVRVELAGEIDLSAAPLLEAVLTAIARHGAVGDVELRLDGLSFAGAALVAFVARLRAAIGGDVYVSDPRGLLRRALDMTGSSALVKEHPGTNGSGQAGSGVTFG